MWCSVTWTSSIQLFGNLKFLLRTMFQLQTYQFPSKEQPVVADIPTCWSESTRVLCTTGGATNGFQNKKENKEDQIKEAKNISQRSATKESSLRKHTTLQTTQIQKNDVATGCPQNSLTQKKANRSNQTASDEDAITAPGVGIWSKSTYVPCTTGRATYGFQNGKKDKEDQKTKPKNLSQLSPTKKTLYANTRPRSRKQSTFLCSNWVASKMPDSKFAHSKES